MALPARVGVRGARARRTLVPPRPDLLAAKFRAKRESGKVDFRPAVGKGSAKFKGGGGAAATADSAKEGGMKGGYL